MKTFKHSGNLGDIIFSLPTIIALGGGTLYISDGKGLLAKPMSQKMVEQIIELLKKQPYLKAVLPYNGEPIDYNLDKFREKHGPGSDMHLAKRHLQAFGVKFDLTLPWLENIEPIHLKEIIIQNSLRHRDIKLNWHHLKSYEGKYLFVGQKDEYRKFKRMSHLKIDFHQTNSILELAQIVKGSKLFIGNQSLGFAIAESLKHPRILEVSYQEANVMPQTYNGYIILRKRIIDYYLAKERPYDHAKKQANKLAQKRDYIARKHLKDLFF